MNLRHSWRFSSAWNTNWCQIVFHKENLRVKQVGLPCTKSLVLLCIISSHQVARDNLIKLDRSILDFLHFWKYLELCQWICIRLSLNRRSTCVKWIPPETDSDGYNLTLTQDDLTATILWVGATDALIWETEREREEAGKNFKRGPHKNGRKV